MFSEQACDEVADGDGDDQGGHDAADEQLGEPGLDAGSGVGADQAADAEGTMPTTLANARLKE
jgi:hypothetical protein